MLTVCQGYFWFSLHPPANWLGSGRRLGGDRAGTADPSYPEGYCMPCTLLSNKAGEGIFPRQSWLRHCLGMSLWVSSGDCLFFFIYKTVLSLWHKFFLLLPFQFSPWSLPWEGVREGLVSALLLASHCVTRGRQMYPVSAMHWLCWTSWDWL